MKNKVKRGVRGRRPLVTIAYRRCLAALLPSCGLSYGSPMSR